MVLSFKTMYNGILRWIEAAQNGPTPLQELVANSLYAIQGQEKARYLDKTKISKKLELKVIQS